MRLLTALSAVLILGAAAGAAFGEDEGSRAIQKGRWSIEISLPDGGGNTFGIRKMVSARSNFGVDLGLAQDRNKTPYSQSLARSYSFSRWVVSLQPSVKRYLSLHQSVSPYLLGAIKGEYGWLKETNTGSPPFKGFTRSAAASLGLGVEWTPLETIGIGAYTGLTLSLSGTSQGIGTSQGTVRSDHFGTVDSGLTMNLYF